MKTNCPHCNKEWEYKEKSILLRKVYTDGSMVWIDVLCDSCKYIFIDWEIKGTNEPENNIENLDKFIKKHAEEIEEINKINEAQYHDWKNRKLVKRRYFKGEFSQGGVR